MSAKRLLPVVLICVIAAVAAFIARTSRHTSPFADLDPAKTAEEIGALMHTLASKPHRAGSKNNSEVSAAIVAALRDSGFQPVVQEFSARLASPIESTLELTAPEAKVLSLHEKSLPEDPYSVVAPEELLYFAYSPDSDLEAEVIYANYGSREDYEYIRSKGIDPAGKIALVRAQGICRGMKAMIAEQQGVAGLLLYPELKDQGFLKAPFPEGPHTNPWVAQRGSLLKYFLRPGNPDPALPEETLPRVPALPISGFAAEQIFQALQGVSAPKDWQGWIKQPYNIGPGPARARMTTRQKVEEATLRNVLAELPAGHADAPVVVVGSHYDAWVYGASDPVSGTVAVLKTAQVLGRRYQQGWRPKVTLLFAFWDGEEPGMFGSSEWVRKNGNRKIAAYVNVDSAYRSPYFVGNLTPGMTTPLLNVLASVEDPLTKTKISETHGEFPLPGFSSDAGPFLGYTGAPVAEIGFGINFPMYHSIYDDLTWMEKFGDPGYRYHATLVKILGLYLEQFTDQHLLPYGLEDVPEYVQKELLKIAGTSGVQVEGNEPAAVKLEQGLQRFRDAAARMTEFQREKKNRKPDQTREANIQLMAAMKALQELNAEKYGAGVFYGASSTEGCPAFPFPRAQEAALSGNLQLYHSEIERIAGSLENSANHLDQAANSLK